MVAGCRVSISTPSAARRAAKTVVQANTPKGRGNKEAVKKVDLQRARQALGPVHQHALDWIVDYLVINKAEILLTKGNLESGEVRAQLVVQNDDDVANTADDAGEAEVMPDVWHRTYSTCKSVPKYYISHWLVDGPAKLPQTLVDKIDAKNPGNGLRRVFQYFSGLGELTWWAPALHIRLVLTAWLAEQFICLGGPARVQVLKAAISSDGSIAYDALVPFILKWSEVLKPIEEYADVDESQLPRLVEIHRKFIPGKKATDIKSYRSIQLAIGQVCGALVSTSAFRNCKYVLKLAPHSRHNLLCNRCWCLVGGDADRAGNAILFYLVAVLTCCRVRAVARRGSAASASIQSTGSWISPGRTRSAWFGTKITRPSSPLCSPSSRVNRPRGTAIGSTRLP